MFWGVVTGGRQAGGTKMEKTYSGKSQFKAPTVNLEDVILIMELECF